MATELMFFWRNKQTKDSLWSFLCLLCCQHYGIISPCFIKHGSLGFGNPVQGRPRQSVSVFCVHVFEWVVNSISVLNRTALARQEILPSSPVAFLSWRASGIGASPWRWEQWSSLETLTLTCKQSLSDQARCSKLSDLGKVAVKK